MAESLPHLLAIGLFVFGMGRTSYEEFQRRASWRYGTTERYGARAAGQFIGAGDETITLSGTLVPEIAGNYADIERLREMAESGEQWPLVLGTGEILGHFRILSIDENWKHLIAGGRGRSNEFSIELQRVEDSDVQRPKQQGGSLVF